MEVVRHLKHRQGLTVTLALIFTLLWPGVLVSRVSAQGDVADDWWDQSWKYRVPYELYSGDYNRTNVPVELMINFTSWLDEFGVQGTFDENSTRVVEYNNRTGEVWEVPSQFDKDPNYDARSNATGIVTWIMKGTIPANTTKTYHVYFDILENGAKSPPNYSGVSSRISGDYVFLQNEKINLTIRYKNKTSIEGLYFDRNHNGVFESEEEMIGEDTPYSVAVRVTDAEKEEHGWTFPFFTSSFNEESTLTFLRDGPVVKEIELSGISLKNSVGEACNITADFVFKVYNMSTRAYVKTILTVNEDLEVSYAYEYDFLNHKELYDRWYVDEINNGKFTYKLDYQTLYRDVPSLGFVTSYNSLGNGGIAFIPDISSYSKVQLLEYDDEGASVRLELTPGLWKAGVKITLENRLFVYLGDWSKVKEETLNINYPPVFIGELRVHSIDNNKIDLAEAKVKVYDTSGDVVRIGITDSKGWVTFERIEFGNYAVSVFVLGQQVANKTISFFRDMTVDPLECYFYSLTVHTLNAEESPVTGVSVRTYLPNGTRISSADTNSSGYVFFSQLPIGVYVVKTYYQGQQFGNEESVYLTLHRTLKIYEASGLGAPQPIRHDIIYVFLVVGVAILVTILIRTRAYEKIKLGLLLSILILVVFLVTAIVQGSNYQRNSLEKGISATFERDTGFATVGDLVLVRWKDIDRTGSLDDWNIHFITSDQTELIRLDLQTSLVTPAGTYALYEAETRDVFFFDKAMNEYSLYKPLLQEPDFTNDQSYKHNLELKFVFSKPNQWEVAILSNLEKGKPYVQLSWEITEKGEGTGDYSLYPEFIPMFQPDRMVLPANYADNKLRYWNQKNGPSYGNPWTAETSFSTFSGYIGTMHVDDGNLSLHSSENYETETSVYASSAFSHSANWVHNTNATPAYFQFDFWIDWDGEDRPSSDIKIEVWVPDSLDLNHTELSFSPDGSRWIEFIQSSLIEGDRGDSGFTMYNGSTHRLQIVFPADIFTIDDGDDTGSDYGNPLFVPTRRNDEYLVRLKIAYLNQGLTTYEYEDSPDTWYGLQNMDDSWIWLIGSKQESWSVGIVPSHNLKHLSSQSEDTELYKKIRLGISESLTNNSRTSFYTNLVFFMVDQAARLDHNSDGVWNMFDKQLPESFPHSALFGARETLGEITYEKWGFDDTNGYHYLIFDTKPLINEWNSTPQFTICLPKEIDHHLESDDTMFRFERQGYYVYDVGQSREILWRETATDMLPIYQLFTVVGLTASCLVLFMRSRDVVRKHRLILILFIIGFGIRLYFQSLSVDFVGSDAALYGNVAENFLGYGKLQKNYLGVEPHYARVGLLPIEVTTPYKHSVDRLIYLLQIALAFAVVGKSFFAIKFVDVICGSLLILPTFYLARKLFDRKTATIAALIVIFHPLLMYYSGVHPSTNILPALFGTVALSSMLNKSKKAAFVTGVSSILLLLARFEYGLILMAAVLTYHVIFFKRSFWRERSFQIILSMFLISVTFLILWSYLVYGYLVMFSTRVLGGGLGQLRAPTLLETLTNPSYAAIRLYNAVYGWWYVVYQDSPFIFITAVLGLLINIKYWKKLSSIFLFPSFAVLFYSLATRTQPQSRFIVQYLPVFAILSAVFIIKLSNVFSNSRLHKIKLRKEFRLKQILLVFIFVEMIFMSFFPRFILIHTAMRNWVWRFNNGEVYQWIKVNTPSNSIIMAYSPVFTFYTERETVHIPTPLGTSGVDLGMIVSLIKRYKVDYLVLDYTVKAVLDLRELLEDPLSSPKGFNLVYWEEDPTAFNQRLLIYDVRALSW